MKSEIRITHVHLDTPLILSEDCVQLLIIENPSEFYNTVFELDGQFDGKEGNFVFSSEGQIISAAKNGVMVSDFFHFDLNDKKILNLLYKKIEGSVVSEKTLEFNELTAKTVGFLEDVSFLMPFELEYDEPQIQDYLKAAGVKFQKDYDSLEEKIICYINALIELKNCEFFIFVNLKSVLNDQKLQQIYDHCRAEQVGLLLIENTKTRPLLLCEKAVVITEDLCEILENYEETC